jgi:hypothetical protein
MALGHFFAAPLFQKKGIRPKFWAIFSLELSAKSKLVTLSEVLASQMPEEERFERPYWWHSKRQRRRVFASMETFVFRS